MNQIQSKPKRPGAISPADFFSKDSEKTKLNWFLFEFAAGIQSRIGKPLEKRLRKAGIYAEAPAAFLLWHRNTVFGFIGHGSGYSLIGFDQGLRVSEKPGSNPWSG
jgi:hypothetical protein